MAAAPGTVDEYIAGFPPEVAERLTRIRETIQAAMPGGEEKVRYGMPAVMLEGVYGLHFAGWKKHIGLYPVPVFDDALEAELAPYRREKDTVAFLHRDPLPYGLISRVTAAIVAMRSAR